MPLTPDQPAASKSVVPGCFISPSFLELIGAPKFCKTLAFSVEVGGLLKCKVDYLTGDISDDEHVVMTHEWEVQLPTDSLFYQLLTGATP